MLGLRAVRYTEKDSEFGAPADLGGGPLAPSLTAVALPDGRHLVVGLRLASVQDGADVREIVALERQAWKGLGNPESEPDHARRIGVPVAAAAPDGRVHLFVRNAGQGISTRVRDRSGVWSPWRELGGGPVQDGLTAVVGDDGEVHVYAAGRDTVHHWTPRGPAPLSGLPAPADAVAASGDRLYYRPPASAELLSSGGPRVDFPGYGPVAAAGAYLLGRDTDGNVRLHHAGRTLRPSTAPATLEGPALALTARGPAAAGLSPDARPWLWRPTQARA